MQKLFLNVAASLLFVAPVVPVQAPAGAGQAPASLDTKPKKLKARMMLEMVRDINAKFGDDKTHVTCWTCHRGSTEPEIARPTPK